MNNIHDAPPYKQVPGLKPVITDYLASLSTDIMNAIETYKKQAGSRAFSIDQLQQQITASIGQEAVVVRAGYLSVEEDVTFGSPTKPVIDMADGINTNKEVTLTVYGNLILENGLKGNTKLNVHVNRVNQSYGN